MSVTLPASIEIQDLFRDMTTEDKAEFLNEFGRWIKHAFKGEVIDIVDQLSEDGRSGIITLQKILSD